MMQVLFSSINWGTGFAAASRSTQPCIHPGSLNRPALIAIHIGKSGKVMAAGWQTGK